MYVRSRQRRKDRTDNQKRVIIQDEEVAEAINKYFGSVYEKEDGGAVGLPIAAEVPAEIFPRGGKHTLYQNIHTFYIAVYIYIYIYTVADPGIP